jgi:hypothetical protein
MRPPDSVPWSGALVLVSASATSTQPVQPAEYDDGGCGVEHDAPAGAGLGVSGSAVTEADRAGGGFHADQATRCQGQVPCGWTPG